MKKKSILLIIGITVILILVIIKLSSNKKKIEAGKVMVDRSHIPVTVNTETVKMMDMNSTIIRPATISPNERATISPSMPGKLERFDVELGTKVTKGQIIGKIDTKTYDVQLRNAQLAADKMKADFNRNKTLYEGNALSESQYLDSKYGMEAKQLEADQLKQQIDESYIKSPLNGIITDKQHVSGEFVGGGTPLATVEDVNQFKVFIYVNESEVRFIKLGEIVHIKSDVFPTEDFKGKVSYVAPSADNNFNYKIEILVNPRENKDLKSGAYVTVLLKSFVEGEKALQIPKKALVKGIKESYVFIQNGKYAEKRVVRLGRENGEYVEVLSGLKEGDIVVTDGQINIVDKSLIQSKGEK